jgi:hypothetical protein
VISVLKITSVPTIISSIWVRLLTIPTLFRCPRLVPDERINKLFAVRNPSGILGIFAVAVVNFTIWLDGGESIKITTSKGEIEYEFSETPISAARWIDYRVKGLVREIHVQGQRTLFFDQDAQQDTGGKD